MVNKHLIDFIFDNAPVENKDAVIRELINHIIISYYDDKDATDKVNNILGMLAAKYNIININRINCVYIRENIAKLNLDLNNIYEYKNIIIKNIDNITGNVIVEYQYRYRKTGNDWETNTLSINYFNNSMIIIN